MGLLKNIGVTPNEGGEFEVGREAEQAAVSGEAVNGKREIGVGGYEGSNSRSSFEVKAAGNCRIKNGVLDPLELHVDKIARLNVDEGMKVGGDRSRRIVDIQPWVEHHFL